jgi:hypothetical protein
MRTPRPLSLRRGRCNSGHVLMLVVLLALAAGAAIRLSAPSSPPQWRERVLATLVALLWCFVMLLAASALLAGVEVLRRAASRYRLKQAEKKLAPAGSFDAVRQALRDLGLRVRAERGSWRLTRPGSHKGLVIPAPREGEVLSLDQMRRMLEEKGLLGRDEPEGPRG